MSADGEIPRGDPYRLDGGTSMAAPHITGTIALMFQKNPSRTQAQIKECLDSSARSDGKPGRCRTPPGARKARRERRGRLRAGSPFSRPGALGRS